MPDVVCFLIEPTGWTSVYARRYASGSSCPAAGNDAIDPDRRLGIHSAMKLQAVVEMDIPSSGAPTDSQRGTYLWPETCDHCEYRFSDEDTWQRLCRTRYARQDRGDDIINGFDLEDAPVGAMYRADWYEESMAGPDGESLVVVLPNGAGPWCIDGPSSNGDGWTRTGAPPELTVSPSIGRRKESGGYLYHGFLRDGVLVDA